MYKLNPILVPTDFSVNSAYANEFAVEVAKKAGADLLLFHAYHIPVNDPISPVYSHTGSVNPGQGLMIEHEKMINDKLASLCNDINVQIAGAGINCRAIAKAGFLLDQILVTCKEENVGLVVMGAQGATGLKGALLGSNTSSVIQKARCPVLAIPEGAIFANIHNVAFAADFDEGQIGYIQNLIDFIEPIQAQVMVVHIDNGEENEQERENFKQRIKNEISYGKLSFHLFENVDILEGVNEAITTLKTDMLAMARRKKGFFQNLFSMDITAKMADRIKLPLLVFHQE